MEHISMKLGTCSPAWAQDLIECRLYQLSWAPLRSVPFDKRYPSCSLPNPKERLHDTNISHFFILKVM